MIFQPVGYGISVRVVTETPALLVRLEAFLNILFFLIPQLLTGFPEQWSKKWR
jgi:hypothetical protein